MTRMAQQVSVFLKLEKVNYLMS